MTNKFDDNTSTSEAFATYLVLCLYQQMKFYLSSLLKSIEILFMSNFWPVGERWNDLNLCFSHFMVFINVAIWLNHNFEIEQCSIMAFAKLYPVPRYFFITSPLSPKTISLHRYTHFPQILIKLYQTNKQSRYNLY